MSGSQSQNSFPEGQGSISPNALAFSPKSISSYDNTQQLEDEIQQQLLALAAMDPKDPQHTETTQLHTLMSSTSPSGWRKRENVSEFHSASPERGISLSNNNNINSMIGSATHLASSAPKSLVRTQKRLHNRSTLEELLTRSATQRSSSSASSSLAQSKNIENMDLTKEENPPFEDFSKTSSGDPESVHPTDDLEDLPRASVKHSAENPSSQQNNSQTNLFLGNQNTNENLNQAGDNFQTKTRIDNPVHNNRGNSQNNAKSDNESENVKEQPKELPKPSLVGLHSDVSPEAAMTFQEKKTITLKNYPTSATRSPTRSPSHRESSPHSSPLQRQEFLEEAREPEKLGPRQLSPMRPKARTKKNGEKLSTLSPQKATPTRRNLRSTRNADADCDEKQNEGPDPYAEGSRRADTPKKKTLRSFEESIISKDVILNSLNYLEENKLLKIGEELHLRFPVGEKLIDAIGRVNRDCWIECQTTNEMFPSLLTWATALFKKKKVPKKAANELDLFQIIRTSTDKTLEQLYQSLTSRPTSRPASPHYGKDHVDVPESDFFASSSSATLSSSLSSTCSSFRPASRTPSSLAPISMPMLETPPSSSSSFVFAGSQSPMKRFRSEKEVDLLESSSSQESDRRADLTNKEAEPSTASPLVSPMRKNAPRLLKARGKRAQRSRDTSDNEQQDPEFDAYGAPHTKPPTRNKALPSVLPVLEKSTSRSSKQNSPLRSPERGSQAAGADRLDPQDQLVEKSASGKDSAKKVGPSRTTTSPRKAPKARPDLPTMIVLEFPTEKKSIPASPYKNPSVSDKFGNLEETEWISKEKDPGCVQAKSTKKEPPKQRSDIKKM